MQPQRRPEGVDPHQWNSYIRSAQSFRESSDRIAAAIDAGVNFAYMGAIDVSRHSRIEDWSWPTR